MCAAPAASTNNANDSDTEDEAGQDDGEDDNEDDYATGNITIDYKMLSKMKFSILANSSEKYMQIRLGPVIFRDSFKFVDSGLATLISNQRKQAKGSSKTLAECFPILSQHHPFLNKFPGELSLDLILQKVPMAYTSIVNNEYFSLPAVLPKDAYDNDLAEEACTDKEYDLVHTVVKHFDMKNQGDYHDLYLWTDVLALADCMESMRRGWRQHCGLDLLKSITLPSASYQAMLKMTKVRLELICDGAGAGMPLMEALNSNIRGGASCIFQPYAAANNPRVLPKYPEKPIIPQEVHERIRKGHNTIWEELPAEYIEWCRKEGYNWEEELSWIIYIDANSLYPTTCL